MWYLYLDESGDLGFDFVNSKPSRFFTVCIITVIGDESNRQLTNIVRRTIRRKLNPKGRSKAGTLELKGSSTSLEIKKYFYRHLDRIDFKIFSLTLNKLEAFERLSKERVRIYDYLTGLLLEHVPLEQATQKVQFILDRRLSRFQIQGFNDSMIRQLQGRLPPKVPLYIDHRDSKIVEGLQVVDLFSWGILRKYEMNDQEWFKIYSEKIAYEEVYGRLK